MKNTTNVTTGYLCHCLRITGARFEEMIEGEPLPTYEKLKEKYGIGSMCSSCEFEAKSEIAEYVQLHPEKTVAGRRSIGLWNDLQFGYQLIRERLRPKPERATARPYQTGIYFMRRDGLETRLVLSNMRFPEDRENPNGPQVAFQAALFGENGQFLALSHRMTLADGASREWTPTDLFPNLTGDFVGGLYVDFEPLAQTGSLRPYGVLVSTDPAVQARCHFHDKFGSFRVPGFYQNGSVFEPGQTCWLAAANCQPGEYQSAVYLKCGGKKYAGHVTVPAMGGLWKKVEDLFPDLSKGASHGPGHFWLENPQPLMVYFFWKNEAFNTWMGQHH